MSNLVTEVRCVHCGVRQTVIGPSTHPTTEEPGWDIDPSTFYKPTGNHYCPRHSRRRRRWEDE